MPRRYRKPAEGFEETFCQRADRRKIFFQQLSDHEEDRESAHAPGDRQPVVPPGVPLHEDHVVLDFETGLHRRHPAAAEGETLMPEFRLRDIDEPEPRAAKLWHKVSAFS